MFNVHERESHRPRWLVVLEDPLVTLLLRVALHQSEGVPSHSQAPAESDLSTFLRAVYDETIFGDSIPVASPVQEHLGVLIVGPGPGDRSLWAKYQLHPRAVRVDTPGKVVASQKSFWTASTLSSIPRVIESQRTSLRCRVGLSR